MFENNIGDNKRFTTAPTCHFRGKEIPALVTCSKSGSITADIMVAILAHIDKHKVYDDRNEGSHRLTPMLIVDGHGSRFEGAKLMKYALDDQHKWEIHIGVPYGTGLWQLGDAVEQNGCFKVECYREKDILFKFKRVSIFIKT